MCKALVEDKKVPPRPNSERLIAAVMALPVEEHTYTKIVRLGKGLSFLVISPGVLSGQDLSFISW